jgi:hypothetical protein
LGLFPKNWKTDDSVDADSEAAGVNMGKAVKSNAYFFLEKGLYGMVRGFLCSAG